MIIEQNGESLKVTRGEGEYKYVNPRLTIIVEKGEIIGCEWRDQHLVACNARGAIGENGCCCFTLLKNGISEDFIEDIVHHLGDVNA